MKNKITFEQACQIRHDFTTMNATQIAEKWNIPRPTIASILNNRIHKIKPLGDTTQITRVYERAEE